MTGYDSEVKSVTSVWGPECENCKCENSEWVWKFRMSENCVKILSVKIVWKFWVKILSVNILSVKIVSVKIVSVKIMSECKYPKCEKVSEL